MVKAFLVVLEGGAAGEDRLALLDRRHPAGAEAAAIAYPVDLIDHRQGGVTRTQEITVQRVHVAIRLDRLAGRRHALTEHLTTEQLTKPQILADAAKEVLFNGLQAQQGDQLVQYLTHACSPITAKSAANVIRDRPVAS